MLEEIFDTLGIKRYKNFDEVKIKKIISEDDKNKKLLLMEELDKTVDLHKFSILISDYHDMLREIQWREEAPKRAYQWGFVEGLKEKLDEETTIKIALEDDIPEYIIADALNIPEAKIREIKIKYNK